MTDSIIIEGQEYTLYCPWGAVLRTKAIELIEESDGEDEYLHSQTYNTMGDTICVDSEDFRIEGKNIYLYNALCHFTRRHQELQFDPYEDVEVKRASQVAKEYNIDTSWLDRDEDD